MKQVRFCGLGGQGIVLAGLLLGEAGVMEGKYVAGANSYGAQARGSACTAEVILSEGPIDFPHVTAADVLVAMSQGAYDLYRGSVGGDGLVLYDTSPVRPGTHPDVRHVGIGATDAAIKTLMNKQAANIVLLGALVETVSLVGPKALEKAMRKHVGQRFLSLNLEAFETGRELARRTHG